MIKEENGRRSPARRLPAWAWIGLGLLAGGLIVGTSLILGQANGLRMATRYTARLSFWWFLLAYLAGPSARLTPLGLARTALLNRRGLGLGFAMVHLVHLGALIAYVHAAGLHPKATTVSAGGLAYGLLLAMVATSSDGARRWLGPWWRRLHRLGLHGLWLVFVLTLVGDVQARSPDPFIHAIMIAAALAALAIRLAAALGDVLRRPEAA